MVFAFMSYRQHFTDKAVALVEKALEFRLIELHLERLADIALSPPERGQDALSRIGVRSSGVSKYAIFRSAIPRPSLTSSRM
jgi:ABC-type bacteriocin/lantibiotic exporter with double-glycine peptidase domain